MFTIQCMVNVQVQNYINTKRISNEVESMWWMLIVWRVLALNPKEIHKKVCPKNSLDFISCLFVFGWRSRPTGPRRPWPLQHFSLLFSHGLSRL